MKGKGEQFGLTKETTQIRSYVFCLFSLTSSDFGHCSMCSVRPIRIFFWYRNFGKQRVNRH